MYAEKRILANLPMPYAVCAIRENGRRKALVASEQRNGPCYLVDRDSGECETIWTYPGGAMNVVPDEGGTGFWAIRRFYPVFQSEDAEIIFAKRNAVGWDVSVKGRIPYVHRIGLVTIGGEKHLLACSLCGNKRFQDDWSCPGAVYIASTVREQDGLLRFVKIVDGIQKNHGLTIVQESDGAEILIAGGQGVLQIRLEGASPLQWKMNSLLERESSEAILYDIDGDGERELLTIEGFHGDRLNVYRKKKHSWEYMSGADIAFGHVLWAGWILGRKGILLSDRGKEKALYLLFPQSNGTFRRFVIDTGIGATQVEVLSDVEDAILASGHATGQLVEYSLAVV